MAGVGQRPGDRFGDAPRGRVHDDHPVVGPRHFQTQKTLAALQGRNNLWLAGLYTHDIDSHENAILSAVNIARRIDPESGNLRRLTATGDPAFAE